MGRIPPTFLIAIEADPTTRGKLAYISGAYNVNVTQTAWGRQRKGCKNRRIPTLSNRYQLVDSEVTIANPNSLFG
jgi:hypothetical protein